MNSIDFAKKIVDKLFPDENFYAFKLFTKKSEEKKIEKELTEISRINKQSINHGSYQIIN